ncbi:MAG: amidohydrolase family protein [Anaerolineae bacterium]|nr:amidohydrolase family protein [Anaerolineae bacterium]
MRAAGRFVVETHGHLTTLYKKKGDEDGKWSGLPSAPEDGEVEVFENIPLCLYDMERYGVDMVLLKPSMPGTTNEFQAGIVEKYPGKFAAFCADQKLRRACARGEAVWTVQAAAEEVEAALKTGKYIGIGEFTPRDWRREKIYTFKERLEEMRLFWELARDYEVSIDFHEFTWVYGFDTWQLLNQLLIEFPGVACIINHGGYSIGFYVEGERPIKKALAVAGFPMGKRNVFLETGTWPWEYYRMALEDPNIGPYQLLWGSDYGHVPQYIVAQPGKQPSSFSTAMKRWPTVPGYQVDWWGWGLHQIDRLRDYVTQDEINLILGGNAARLWKLPVPHARMFMEGRPDYSGIHWQDTMPFIPEDQIINPD